MIYFIAGYVTGSIWSLVVAALIVRHERRTNIIETVKEPAGTQQNSDTDEDAKEQQAREERLKRLGKQWENMMNYTGKKQS